MLCWVSCSATPSCPGGETRWSPWRETTTPTCPRLPLFRPTSPLSTATRCAATADPSHPCHTWPESTAAKQVRCQHKDCGFKGQPIKSTGVLVLKLTVIINHSCLWYTNHIAGIKSVVKMNFTGRKWSLTGLAHLNSKYVARDVKSLLWFSRHHTENQTRIRRRKNKRQKTVKQHLTTKSALSRLL